MLRVETCVSGRGVGGGRGEEGGEEGGEEEALAL